jgi:glyoxylase-like metal-dependent hydrolase (beta-lactamase superfamily II)
MNLGKRTSRLERANAYSCFRSGESRMNLLRVIGVVVACLGLPSLAMAQQPPIEQVNKAIDAIGRGGLEQLKTIAIKGRGQFWEPDESFVAGGPAVHVADVTYEIRRDVARDAANIVWVRDYLELPWPRMNKYVEVVADGVGFVVGNDGGPRTASLQVQGPERVMSSNRVAATARELKRRSPVLLLEMARQPSQLESHPAVSLGGRLHPAVSYRTDLATFTVIFDPDTSLPVRVRTMDFDPLHGDSEFDWIISDWRAIEGGMKFPHRQQYDVGGRKLMEFEIEEVAFNPSLEGSLFSIPDSVRSSAPKMATSDVPYLWILRRQLIGSYYDVQNLTHDPARVKLHFVERAPGIVQVQGTIHHTLVVEMDTYLIVFDAPYMDGYSKWVIEQIRQRFKNKPIRYLVLTHHHIDHVAGYRTFVAEGAALVVGRGTTAFWRKVVGSSDALGADTPKKKLSEAQIIEVAGSHAIAEGSRRLELYDLRSKHSEGMLIGYIPDAKLVFQTDIWTGPGVDPLGAQAMPRQRSLVDLVEKQKLDVTHVIGGHGRIGLYADLRKTADGSVPSEDSIYVVNNTKEAVDFNVSPNGSYWIPFVLEPGRDARLTNGAAEWPVTTVAHVNVITGGLRAGNRTEVTDKVEKGKRYQIVDDAECKCRRVKPL